MSLNGIRCLRPHFFPPPAPLLFFSSLLHIHLWIFFSSVFFKLNTENGKHKKKSSKSWPLTGIYMPEQYQHLALFRFMLKRLIGKWFLSVQQNANHIKRPKHFLSLFHFHFQPRRLSQWKWHLTMYWLVYRHKCQYCLKTKTMFWLRLTAASALMNTGMGNHFYIQLILLRTVDVLAFQLISIRFKLIKINEVKNVLYLAFVCSGHKVHSTVSDSSTHLMKRTHKLWL